MLDAHLPIYEARDVHSVKVDAPAGAVMDAVREVTPLEVPLLVVLMGIRTVPRLLRGEPLRLRGSILDGMQKTGFVVLRDSPDAIVLGVVGRFWEPASGLRPITATEFAAFDEPGFAKGAIAFWVEPGGVLTTETRVAGTDETARRRFRWYWRVIHPGSAAIRWAWLRAIRRRAERGAQPSSSPRNARA